MINRVHPNRKTDPVVGVVRTKELHLSNGSFLSSESFT